MASFILSAFADEADSGFSGQIAALQENSICQIEVRGVNGKSVADLTDGEAREAGRALSSAGIGVSAMGSPFGKYPISEPAGPHLDAFKRGLDLCDMIGAGRIRMFSFYMPEGGDPAAYRDEVFERLDRMLELASRAGIRLAHENERGIYGDVPERCVDLMENFGSRMGFVFDPANFILCGARTKEAYPMLARWAEYFHIKDALVADGAIVPSGKGEGDIPWLIEQLSGHEGEITLTIEPHLRVFSGLHALQGGELTHAYSYPDNLSAFGAAAGALKSVLTSHGYSELEGGKGIWAR
jgi:sugar phosphate isomerase/epimerase